MDFPDVTIFVMYSRFASKFSAIFAKSRANRLFFVALEHVSGAGTPCKQQNVIAQYKIHWFPFVRQPPLLRETSYVRRFIGPWSPP